MTITIGRRVHYVLTAEQAYLINSWRLAGDSFVEELLAPSSAHAQKHLGSTVIEGDVVPLDVTRVIAPMEGLINGRAILDGNDVLWVTGASEGLEPGTWRWPKRE